MKKVKEQLVKQNPTARAVKSGHLGIASRLAQASTRQASEGFIPSLLKNKPVGVTRIIIIGCGQLSIWASLRFPPLGHFDVFDLKAFGNN